MFLIIVSLFIFIVTLLVACFYLSKSQHLKTEIIDLKKNLKESKTEIEDLREEKDRQIKVLQVALATSEGRQKNTDQDKEDASNAFKVLAGNILDEKVKTFDDTSRKSIEALLEPLKADINNFKSTYNEDKEERFTLKAEIGTIVALAKSLRGDSKAQGQWGELILERVLENSGLKKGSEFLMEESYKNDEGSRLRPDATILLSNDKKLFIDAKVSLTHYDIYTNALDEKDKSSSLSSLTSAFCERIKELGNKEYSLVQGVDTVDFVLLFTPIESVLSLCVQHYEKQGKDLFEFAWSQGVIITSPLTLMPILKTINFCWKTEYQNKNAKNIAIEAGKLHDKLKQFLKHFQSIETDINKALTTFNEAKKVLHTGRGNSLKLIDNIRELLKKEQSIPSEFVELLESEMPEDSNVSPSQSRQQEVECGEKCSISS